MYECHDNLPSEVVNKLQEKLQEILDQGLNNYEERKESFAKAFDPKSKSTTKRG